MSLLGFIEILQGLFSLIWYHCVVSGMIRANKSFSLLQNAECKENVKLFLSHKYILGLRWERHPHKTHIKHVDRLSQGSGK